MSERPSLARLATDLLAEHNVTAGRRSTDPELRRAHIEAVAAAIRQQARQRRQRRWAFGVAAAAALVFVQVGAWHALRGRASLASSVARLSAPGGVAWTDAVPFAFLMSTPGRVEVLHGAERQLAKPGAALRAGDAVRTGPEGSSASVELVTGTQVWLEPSTSLGVLSTSSTQILALDSGAARFSVAPLHGPRRFVVRTADAHVEVRGTRFRVSIEPSSCAPVRTRVEVTEGVVEVQTGDVVVRLTPGQVFPNCVAEPSTSVAPPVSKTTAASPTRSKPVPVVASRAEPKAPSSELAAQNDMFADAMSQKRQGDGVGALRTLDLFLARWPHSPLLENVEVERMRLLRGESAKVAARSYLSRWPRGFARDEALRLIAP